MSWFSFCSLVVVWFSHSSVPESVLKKRKTVDEIKAQRAARQQDLKKTRRAARKEIFKRAEKYVKEYRTQERNLVRLKRQAKNQGQYFLEDERKVVFAIRVRGINRVSPKVRKILQLLRLRQINNGVFIRMNKATANMLQYVQAYITFGQPNLKSVSDLIYKRGHGKVSGQRIPITHNSVIANSLGKYNIICVEDLVHEIYTCGENFKEANNFLWPFKLSNPLGGWGKKTIHFNEGGETGDREELINQLVRKMN